MTRVTERWTAAQDATVRQLATEGRSAREIAARIRGRSRNAVIGFMRRNDIRSDYNRVWLIAHENEAICWHAQKRAALVRGRYILNRDNPPDEPQWTVPEVEAMLVSTPYDQLAKWELP